MQADFALRLISEIVACRAALNALETLATPKESLDGGLLAWSARREGSPWARRTAVALLFDTLLEGRRYLALNALQLVLCAGLLAVSARQPFPAAAIWLALLWCAETLADLRNRRYGRDGSDRMHLLVLTALTLAALLPSQLARSAALVFVAAQLALAYFTAGAVKLLSPRWRTGQAMTIVLASQNLGSPRAARCMAAIPHGPRLAAWSVIAFEMLFPISAILGPRTALAGLVAAFCFHLAVAACMGLNSFVWSFAATYPAFYWLAERIPHLTAPYPSR